jgi:hypothetical protein
MLYKDAHMVTKRQFEKETILNSIDIEQMIMKKIANAMRQMWQFSFKENGNNRSSSKTDLLHTSWENVLKDSFGDHKDLFEKHFELVVEKEEPGSKKTNKIQHINDIFGGKFKVDMLMTHQDKIHTVFLLKAPLTSINKNRYNAALNIFGEIDRFYGNVDNKEIELVFVNLTPKATFITDNKNSAIKKEDVKYLGLNQDDNGNRPIDKLPKEKSIKDKVHEIHIEYELKFDMPLDEIKNKSSLIGQIKTQTNFISLSNNSIDELKIYIEHFISSNENILNISLKNNESSSPIIANVSENIRPAA